MAKGRVIEVERGVARVKEKPIKPSQKIYVRLPEDQPEELFEFQDEAGTQYQDAALQGVLSDIGARDDESKVTVKRIANTGGIRREEWLFECHPSQFSIPTIQDHYGAGEYRVTVYGKQDGTNYKIVHADKRLVIGASLSGEPPKTAVSAAQPVAPVNGQLDMKALAAMIAQLVPKAPSRAEVLAELKEMREIFAAQGNAPAPLDPLTMLERAVTLVKASGPAPSLVNEDGEVPPGALISQGISLVREFFETAKQNRAAAPALAAPDTAHPDPNAARAPMPSVPTQPTQEDEMGIYLKAQLKMLLNAARQDMNTEAYAGLIYEQAPDEVIAKLQSDEWWTELLALEPGFAAVKPWCEKLRADVLAIIAEESEPDAPGDAALTDASPERINPGNAANSN